VGQKDPRSGANSFKMELASFISSETGPRVAAIQSEIKKGEPSAPLYNKAGRAVRALRPIGQSGRAVRLGAQDEGAGERGVQHGEHPVPAGKVRGGLELLQQGLAAQPNDATALLSSAKTSAALGKYDMGPGGLREAEGGRSPRSPISTPISGAARATVQERPTRPRKMETCYGKISTTTRGQSRGRGHRGMQPDARGKR